MPRQPRYCPAGMPVHVVQRGVNRQVIFTSDVDIAAYANWLRDSAEKYQVAIHAWVFMTNHIHLLVTPSVEGAVSRCLQSVGRDYVKYFNFCYGRTGTLFEGRYRSSLVQSDEYLLTCARYIELNPVRVGIVEDPVDYHWSSYRANAFGKRVKLWTPHIEYLALGCSIGERQCRYRALFKKDMDSQTLKNIRDALNTGLVLGNARFKAEVEKLTGQRQTLRKRGPASRKPRDDG